MIVRHKMFDGADAVGKGTVGVNTSIQLMTGLKVCRCELHGAEKGA